MRRAEEGHALSRKATAAFEGARAKLARLINAAEPREIIFCRGATEGLNLVALMNARSGLGPGDEVLITEMEHHSNLAPWVIACRDAGATLKVVPITATADLDLPALEAMLTDRVRILAVTHVSNVTGGVNPVQRITAMAKERGILVLVDGAQAAPHLPVDVQAIGCDFYAGSGHKMGGPSSVGFLWGRAEVLERMPLADSGSNMAASVTFDTVEPKPLPFKYEAGEPAFGEVEAWSPALDYWADLGLEAIAAYERELTEYARARLAEIPGVRVLGDPADRISIVTFVRDGVDAKQIEQALDAEGIAVRAG
ncbi:MAG TPA: cysteine desulfurase, partial [Acetobacteraceae bacterium]